MTETRNGPSSSSAVARPCTADEANAGVQCPAALSAPAADLVCGFVGTQPLCVDPTSTKHGSGSQAYYLHIAERVGPTAYISRAMFLTNKYLNLTARAVRAFDPGRQWYDYGEGTGALVVWGRPGFDDQNREGEAPPFFLYHPLPFEFDGDQIVFQPRYFRGAPDDVPDFSSTRRTRLRSMAASSNP